MEQVSIPSKEASKDIPSNDTTTDLVEPSPYDSVYGGDYFEDSWCS